MAELLGITQALEMLRPHGFTPLQRLLLCQTGTLQSTLSAYFGRETRVRVVHQRDNYGVIHRLAQLRVGARVVCEANSCLDITREDVRQKVLEGRMGIGRVLEAMGVRTSFKLLEVGQDERSFWRTYNLEAPGVHYRITELFSRTLYLEEEAFQITYHVVNHNTAWDQLWSWLLEEDDVSELQDRRSAHSCSASSGECPKPVGFIPRKPASGYALAGRSRLPGATRVHDKYDVGIPRAP